MGTFKNPDVWKQNLAYQIGDFVLYNGIVYMAIKPVPAGTAMSADYWYAFDEGAIVPTGEISITENGEVDVEQYATANVNVEGGGGDFSTATLTVINNYTFFQLNCPHCYVSEDESFSSTDIYTEETQDEFDVILYKGKALAYTNMEGIPITATGNVTEEGEDLSPNYVITGDCTFTVSNPNS